jgi:hypothetical protein
VVAEVDGWVQGLGGEQAAGALAADVPGAPEPFGDLLDGLPGQEHQPGSYRVGRGAFGEQMIQDGVAQRIGGRGDG